jgi:hypothetical protein
MPPTVKPKERNCLLVIALGILFSELLAVSGEQFKLYSELLAVSSER